MELYNFTSMLIIDQVILASLLSSVFGVDPDVIIRKVAGPDRSTCIPPMQMHTYRYVSTGHHRSALLLGVILSTRTSLHDTHIIEINRYPPDIEVPPKAGASYSG